MPSKRHLTKEDFERAAASKNRRLGDDDSRRYTNASRGLDAPSPGAEYSPGTPTIDPTRTQQAQLSKILGVTSPDIIEAITKKLGGRLRADSIVCEMYNSVMERRASREDEQRFNIYLKGLLDTQSHQQESPKRAQTHPQNSTTTEESYMYKSSCDGTLEMVEQRAAPPSVATPRKDARSYGTACNGHPERAQQSLIPARIVKSPPRVHRPKPKYPKHPSSGVGANFHSVPYPLTLLPYQSWYALHDNAPDGAVCSYCQEARPLRLHQRKLFLVAERLSWQDDIISSAYRSQNEEGLWAVNAELGIWDPAVEDEHIAIGGRHSRENEWFPFEAEQEAEAVMSLVEKAEVLSEYSWTLWKRMIQRAQLGESVAGDEGCISDEPHTNNPNRRPLGVISANCCRFSSAGQPTRVKGKDRAIIESADSSSTLPTPPSSGPANAAAKLLKCQMDTLQDFYSFLDKLERTSFMGSKFLEAYAERLRTEVCKDCWFSKNIIPGGDKDEEEEEGRTGEPESSTRRSESSQAQ